MGIYDIASLLVRALRSFKLARFRAASSRRLACSASSSVMMSPLYKYQINGISVVLWFLTFWASLDI